MGRKKSAGDNTGALLVSDGLICLLDLAICTRTCLAASGITVNPINPLTYWDFPLQGPSDAFCHRIKSQVLASIQRAAFSAIISVGLFVLPLVMVGMTPASAMCRPRMVPPWPSNA